MAALHPGDPQLVSVIVNHLKSEGLFDQFRRDCLADVDTKPAYLHLRQRVDNFVSNHLANHTWSPQLNKNQLRNSIRQLVQQSGMLEQGVDRIVSQVVDPKVHHNFRPLVERVVRKFLSPDAHLDEEAELYAEGPPVPVEATPPPTESHESDVVTMAEQEQAEPEIRATELDDAQREEEMEIEEEQGVAEREERGEKEESSSRSSVQPKEENPEASETPKQPGTKQKTRERLREEFSLEDSDLEGLSDITVSSVHTSDLSSFEEDSEGEEDAATDSTEEGEISSEGESGQQAADGSEKKPRGVRQSYVHKPFLYSRYYSDSDDELTVEQRRRSAAKEKEERLLKRQQNRERLEEKRRQRAAQSEEQDRQKQAALESRPRAKEARKEKKFLEKKVALSRERKRNYRKEEDRKKSDADAEPVSREIFLLLSQKPSAVSKSSRRASDLDEQRRKKPETDEKPNDKPRVHSFILDLESGTSSKNTRKDEKKERKEKEKSKTKMERRSVEDEKEEKKSLKVRPEKKKEKPVSELRDEGTQKKEKERAKVSVKSDLMRRLDSTGSSEERSEVDAGSEGNRKREKVPRPHTDGKLGEKGKGRSERKDSSGDKPLKSSSEGDVQKHRTKRLNPADKLAQDGKADNKNRGGTAEHKKEEKRSMEERLKRKRAIQGATLAADDPCSALSDVTLESEDEGASAALQGSSLLATEADALLSLMDVCSSAPLITASKESELTAINEKPALTVASRDAEAALTLLSMDPEVGCSSRLVPQDSPVTKEAEPAGEGEVGELLESTAAEGKLSHDAAADDRGPMLTEESESAQTQLSLAPDVYETLGTGEYESNNASGTRVETEKALQASDLGTAESEQKSDLRADESTERSETLPKPPEDSAETTASPAGTAPVFSTNSEGSPLMRTEESEEPPQTLETETCTGNRAEVRSDGAEPDPEEPPPAPPADTEETCILNEEVPQTPDSRPADGSGKDTGTPSGARAENDEVSSSGSDLSPSDDHECHTNITLEVEEAEDHREESRPTRRRGRFSRPTEASLGEPCPASQPKEAEPVEEEGEPKESRRSRRSAPQTRDSTAVKPSLKRRRSEEQEKKHPEVAEKCRAEDGWSLHLTDDCELFFLLRRPWKFSSESEGVTELALQRSSPGGGSSTGDPDTAKAIEEEEEETSVQAAPSKAPRRGRPSKSSSVTDDSESGASEKREGEEEEEEEEEKRRATTRAASRLEAEKNKPSTRALRRLREENSPSPRMVRGGKRDSSPSLTRSRGANNPPAKRSKR
ncbi:hypothetical protein DNTS_000570 [Danionella cerebrum]|uniref:BOD1/SHG1 domain-containing protein n=1 Tax=Danionella cerebrum TaxID=2873325 RepID=A0A553Q019_9TELE|nr:hypothetical protein DNTS_000570 [Danionella translucida]